MARERSLLFMICLLLAAGGAQAAETPQTVSPGDTSRLALIGNPCPTFSWSTVPGASGYELVVYRVGEQLEEAKPVLRESFAGSASLWTPRLDRCLERGGQYAWSVRLVGRKEASDWSPPSLFEVVSAPSRAELEGALRVVRQYLGADSAGAAAGSGKSAASATGIPPSAVGPSASGSIADPAPRSAVAGDPDFQVNGAGVVTAATLGAGVGATLCLAMDYRYVDQGNGTVLDCNTGLLWLKDGSCADLAGTDPDGRANWTTAQSAAAALADGTCGLTDGSLVGDWRQPTISELCSAWSGANLSPCPVGAASDSLIDSSVAGFPKVANALGDAKWSEEDAFVGVKEGDYWSATADVSSLAWLVDLFDGNVTRSGQVNLAWVWPVRGGP